MAKSEGQQVCEAFDGPDIEPDQLIDQIEARAREQHARSSDASESAAKVSAYLDKTGMNSQAYSWLSSILKKLPKKDGQHKAMDVIRTLEEGLPIIKNHVAGQGSAEMELGEPEPKPVKETAKPKAAKPKAAAKPKGDPELAADAAEFEEQAKSTVTPINFGGAKAK